MNIPEKNFKGEKPAATQGPGGKVLDAWELKSLERFVNFSHPAPIDKEVSWDKSRIIMSKTDAYGVIEYANDTFIDVSGYDEMELMGMPQSIVRHPDMPKVLFKVLWDNLKKGVTIRPIVKNLSRSGRYYWVIADFEIKRNEKGEISHYYSRRKAVPAEVIAKVEPLYEKLLQIETVGGMAASEKYLIGYLEDMGKTYDQLIEDLMIKYTPGGIKPEPAAARADAPANNVTEAESKKGFFSKLFGK
jgi:PAS domain S-box-containing protein